MPRQDRVVGATDRGRPVTTVAVAWWWPLWGTLLPGSGHGNVGVHAMTGRAPSLAPSVSLKNGEAAGWMQSQWNAEGYYYGGPICEQ